MAAISVDYPWLAQHVQIVRLDDQAALATRAALVAFVSVHAAERS